VEAVTMTRVMNRVGPIVDAFRASGWHLLTCLLGGTWALGRGFTGDRSWKKERATMFIAMNRFNVLFGAEAAFEEVWTSRDTHLRGVPGFVAFHLLRGPRREDYVLYSSHTIWRDKEAFEDWTTSEAFRQAHRNAGGNRPLYQGHPEFEGFEVIQTVE